MYIYVYIFMDDILIHLSGIKDGGTVPCRPSKPIFRLSLCSPHYANTALINRHCTQIPSFFSIILGVGPPPLPPPARSVH